MAENQKTSPSCSHSDSKSDDSSSRPVIGKRSCFKCQVDMKDFNLTEKNFSGEKFICDDCVKTIEDNKVDLHYTLEQVQKYYGDETFALCINSSHIASEYHTKGQGGRMALDLELKSIKNSNVCFTVLSMMIGGKCEDRIVEIVHYFVSQCKIMRINLAWAVVNMASVNDQMIFDIIWQMPFLIDLFGGLNCYRTSFLNEKRIMIGGHTFLLKKIVDQDTMDDETAPNSIHKKRLLDSDFNKLIKFFTELPYQKFELGAQHTDELKKFADNCIFLLESAFSSRLINHHDIAKLKKMEESFLQATIERTSLNRMDILIQDIPSRLIRNFEKFGECLWYSSGIHGIN